jgi:adenine-specific DNA-methyltransferase
MFGLKPAVDHFTRVAGGVTQEISGYFDIILGNPPYVRQEQIKDQKPAFKNHYDCFTGTADLYVYFYERSIKLLKPGGAFAFITSNKWYRAAYGEKLRTWLVGNTHILQLIDFGDAPVFTAISYPTIVILQRITPSADEKANEIRAFNWQPGPPIEEFASLFQKQSFGLPQSSLKSDGWRMESSVKLKLLERIRGAGIPLGEYVKGRFYRGILTGLNEAFVVDRATRDRLIAEHSSSAEVLKPFLRGRDVKRWRVEPQDLWLIFTRRGIDIKEYPAILNHLKPYKRQLMPGGSGGRKPGSYEWYEIQDNIAYWREFERPKVILGIFMNKPTYAYDESGLYLNNALYLIAGASPFLVAGLNSSVNWWFLRNTSTDLQNGYLQALKQNQMPIPIPAATEAQKETMVLLVDFCRFVPSNLKDKSIAVNSQSLAIGYIERLLNGLVFELFFPEDLHSHRINLFKHVEEARLPAFAGIPEKQRFSRLEEIYERISNDRHPIRGSLESLKSLEVVRIIEDEK